MAKNVQWKPGKDPMPIINNALQRGTGKAAEHVLAEARKEVPHEEGILEKSGSADNERTRTGARASIFFDQPYAVDQHESMQYRHDKGRKAKYLEDPLNRSGEKVKQIIAKEVRSDL